jgi:hypothetical protein
LAARLRLGDGVQGMPMPACANAQRVVFSCIDQNKETNRKKQRQRRDFHDSIGNKSSFSSLSSVKVF